MLVIRGLFILGLLGLVTSYSAIAAPEYIYLFRHAEKQAGEDPSLSPQGLERAEKLPSFVENYNVTVYSSNYNRTKQTAAPISKHFNTPIHIYNVRDLESLKDKILASEGFVVVIGHSNTTPNLASLITNKALKPMGEGDFSHYYFLRRESAGVGTRYAIEIRDMLLD
jgi:phosphohistidine phosphatase SixA